MTVRKVVHAFEGRRKKSYPNACRIMPGSRILVKRNQFNARTSIRTCVRGLNQRHTPKYSKTRVSFFLRKCRGESSQLISLMNGVISPGIITMVVVVINYLVNLTGTLSFLPSSTLPLPSPDSVAAPSSLSLQPKISCFLPEMQFRYTSLVAGPRIVLRKSYCGSVDGVVCLFVSFHNLPPLEQYLRHITLSSNPLFSTAVMLSRLFLRLKDLYLYKLIYLKVFETQWALRELQ